MEYIVRVDYPKHETTRVTEKEHPAAYAYLTEISSVTVTWNDGGDDVVGARRCSRRLQLPEVVLAQPVALDKLKPSRTHGRARQANTMSGALRALSFPPVIGHSASTA